MKERLQKLLSSAGICSRRKAEEYIAAGRVTVNGIPAKMGDKADPAEELVALDGVLLQNNRENIWLMLHKPRGYVTTLADEKGRKTVADLIEDCGFRLWPVGRLDLNSEGLLLFTNDGEGTNRLLHPKHEIEKEYQVSVTGDMTAALPILTGSIELDGQLLAPAQVKVISQNGDRGKLSVVIHEGKNRQVRRMCALAGLEVTRLVRIREGDLRLENLPCGRWRFLSQEEIRRLSSPEK